MKELIRLPLVLGITTIIAATALSLVNNTTKPLIEEQKRRELQASLAEALPSAANGVVVPVLDEEGKVDYYKGYADKDTTQLVGYITLAYGVGYSSTIVTMVGVDTTGVIQGMRILDQLETPGLGAKVVEIKYGEDKPWFQRQFIGRRADELKVDKDGGEIQSITGATISSRAVTNSVRQAIQNLAKKIGGFPQKEKPTV
jgi:electron transport complex protein RnfG